MEGKNAGEETGEDLSIKVTDDEKEEKARRMVVEKHLKICHCRNYLVMMNRFFLCLQSP